MNDSREIIEGKKIQHMFVRLLESKTFLKVSIPGHEAESLTLISGLRPDNEPTSFFIDLPEMLLDVLENVKTGEMVFEFVGEDRTKYRFATELPRSLSEIIRLPVPESIERIQKRKDFRLVFPRPIKIIFSCRSVRYKLRAHNVSCGGAYIEPQSTGEGFDAFLTESNGSNLEDIRLIFTFKNIREKVAIPRIVVKRVEKDPVLSKRNRYAIQFMDLSMPENRKLTRLIYRFQREMLKNRLR